MKVQPFKQQQDIEKLKWHLRRRSRDLALLVVGINCHLRFRDLIQLRVKNIENIEIDETFTINGQIVTMNEDMFHALKKLIRSKKYTREEFLFQGKTRSKPISYKTGHELVKRWASWLHIPENYGSSSLRKTFGYHQYQTGETAIEVLRKLFNYKTLEGTMNYLGIERRH